MNEWIDALANLAAAGERVVVVTIAGIRGSAPREAGAKMLVTARETLGTIGGGQLEFECTRIAVGMLGSDATAAIRSFPLGTSFGQCCGGVVDVLFERVSNDNPAWLRDIRALHQQREPAMLCTPLGGVASKCVVTADAVFAVATDEAFPDIVERARSELAMRSRAVRHRAWFFEPVVGSDFNIAVFGAGHVGAALVRSLCVLDCNIRWIDNRRDIFRGVPPNVRTMESDEPALEVAAMPPQSCYFVITHSHALDFEICDRILRRGDAAYCGLIGSVSKRRRFEKRYRAQGMRQEVLARLVCPIGVDGINGKKPAEIAIAAAADVLRAYERSRRNVDIAYPDNVYPL